MGKTKRKEESDSQNKKQPRPAGDEETEPKKKKVLSEASQDECSRKSDKNKGNAGTDPKKKKLKRSAEDEQPARASEPKKNKNRVISEVTHEGSRTISKNKGNAGTDLKKKRLRRSAQGEQPARAAAPPKKKKPTDASQDGEPPSASRRSQNPAAQMTADDLTPEEVRVFERKLKKERKKEEKKVRREGGAGDPPDAGGAERPSGAALALRYLQSWSRRAPDWRFQKTRQTWLLLRMYDARELPDQHFELLLRYLEGLRGGARELTVRKAEALMREHEQSEDPALRGKMDRARQVIQLLS